MRFDEKRGIYRDCKWCHGKGCLACPGEADKEYQRQFPNGPQPIATFSTEGMDEAGIASLIGKLIGGEAIAAAQKTANQRAVEMIANQPHTLDIARHILPTHTTQDGITKALGEVMFNEVLAENIKKASRE